MKKIELEIVALSHSITQTHSYAVVLGEVNGVRRLPIVIGGFEAQAIAVALERMQPSRPLTHDLLKTVIAELGGTLTSVIINDLSDDIFYARLVLDADGRHVEIDSRPSDAIALAVRMKAPIYVAENVMDQAGVTVREGVDLDEAHSSTPEVPDNLDVYRDFINTLDALDEFGKPD